MSSAPATAPTTAPAPAASPRRVRHWWPSALGAILIALGAAYVALPILAPVDWLARRVEWQLSGEMQRRVTIGRLSLGWVRGVCVEDVTVGELPGAANPYLVHIDQVHCEFAPLRMLMDDRVARLDINGPDLWLVRGDDGKLNVDDLLARKPPRLPAHKFAVHDATCQVVSVQGRQTLRIDTAEFRLEPERARLDLSVSAVVPLAGREADLTAARRLAVDAHLIVPKLRRELNLPLSGSVHAEWTNLRLVDLPLALIPTLPVEQAGGATSGVLKFEVLHDLSIDFTQRVELSGVQLTWAGMTRRAVVPDAYFACTGHWDPGTDHLRVRGLEYETQAVHLRTPPGAVIEVDPRGRQSLVAALRGEIKDWHLLRREVPQFDQLATELGLDAAGAATFSVEAGRQGDEAHCALKLDAQPSRWTLRRGGETYFIADAGLAKTLEVTVNGAIEARRITPSVRLVLGDLSATLSGTGGPPAADSFSADLTWPVGVEAASAAVELHTPHVERVLAMFPTTVRVPELAGWRGPMRAQLKVAPASGGSRVDLQWATDADTALGWEDWFAKPPGAPLALTAGFMVPHARAGHISALTLQADYAGGRLETGAEPASVQYRFGADDDSFDLDARLPLLFSRVEKLAALCPRWLALASADSARSVAGSMQVGAQVSMSHRSGEDQARVIAEVDAGGLAARWAREFDKPAGEPLLLHLDGRSKARGDERSEQLAATFEEPGARVEAAFARATGGAPRPGSDTEHCQVTLEVRDVRDGLRLWPALSERISAYQPAGACSAGFIAARVGEHRTAEAWVQGDKAAFILPGEEPGAKPAGVPASLRMSFEGTADDASGFTTWKLKDGTAQLAGLNLTAAEAEVVARPVPAASASLPPQLVELLGGSFMIDGGQLALSGSASCTDDLNRLVPGFARLRDRLGLSGAVTWEAQVSGNSEALHFTGRLDGSALAWTIPTAIADAPRVVRPAGMPLTVTVDAAVTDGPDGPTQRLDGRLEVALDGNRLTVDGTALLDGVHEGAPRVSDADAVASLSIDRPDRLAVLVPGAAAKLAEGSLRVDAAATQRDGKLRPAGGQVNFHTAKLAAGDTAFTLDGAVAWDESGIHIPGLNWRWGQSAGRIEGLAGFARGGVEGDLRLDTEKLDVVNFQEEAGKLLAALSPPHVAGTDTQPEEPGGLTPQRVLEYLGQSDVRVNGEIGTLESILPPGILVKSTEVSYRLVAERGPVSFTFAGTADDGAIHGEVRTRADAAEPAMRLTYTAERIQPGPLVDIYLRTTFPGMTASGPVTIIDESNQKLFPKPGELNYPTGTGELIIEGGRLVGRAAPKVVTKLFPGLNLATFDFSYMHSWFRKDELGRIHHQMIYKGHNYNMYMDGYGGPHGFRYEVGVDFFADFDSKYWAESGQGRIPLFTKTGRLKPDGSIADEIVEYMPQSFFETVLVRNNPVFTAYHAVRKRVREEQ